VIPIWKLKREVQRLADQVSAIPLLVFEPFIQFQYDRNFPKNISVHQGVRPLEKKIAVFLIYQPKGLAQSIFLTVDHLISSGFEAVVVSNCPLQIHDLELLKLKSALVVERKNFGYDFGGYRDAIFLLRQHHVDCEQMLFLNDSVWFPVFDGSQLLKDMSASEADYVGTQVFGEWRGQSFNGFFGSYCFMLKKPLLNHEVFKEFWDKYKLSSSKEVVLRRGERRFSREMLKVSSKSLALFSLERFAQTLDQMSIEETCQALKDLIVWDHDALSEKMSLINADMSQEKWLLEAKNFIVKFSRSKNFVGSSPVTSLTRLQFPMIKKNSDMLYTQARESIVNAIDTGRITGLNPIIERELRQKVFQIKE